MTGLGRISLVALGILMLDRASKYYVVEVLDLRNLGAIDVLPPFVNFRMAWNQGVNFGLMDMGDGGGRWVLTIVSLVIVAAVLWWLRRATGWLVALSGGAIIGGALGNVWDRLQHGAVADFLNMSCCGINNPYSFNLADAAIFVGAAGLILFGGKIGEKRA